MAHDNNIPDSRRNYYCYLETNGSWTIEQEEPEDFWGNYKIRAVVRYYSDSTSSEKVIMEDNTIEDLDENPIRILRR